MGGSLPALVRFFSRDDSGLDRGIAGCHALNSLGGVVGCLLADFLLIPQLVLAGVFGVGIGIGPW